VPDTFYLIHLVCLSTRLGRNVGNQRKKNLKEKSSLLILGQKRVLPIPKNIIIWIGISVKQNE